MREYETTFIARADLSDEAVKQLFDRVKTVIERHHGALLDSQIMGRQNLAYAIEKQTKGNYVYFDYAADTTAVSEVERTLRLDETVLKFLSVKINDDITVEARREEIRVRKEKIAAAIVAATAVPVTSEATEEVTEAVEEGANA